MNFIKYFLCCVSLLFCENVIAQSTMDTIAQRNMFQYRYQGQLYSKYYLGKEVLKNDPASAATFYNYQTANLVVATSLGLMLVESYWYIGLDFGETCTRGCRKIRRIGGEYIFGVIAAKFGIATVVFLISRIKFFKSIRLFNEARREKTNIGNIPLELKLQPTNYGIGLVLNF